MIPQRIKALFEFIDYLDINKREYIEKYIPLCCELRGLYNQKNQLRPNENYIDNQKYNRIQSQIEEKFSPILSNIYNPISSKLKELSIWSGDKTYSSIWNNNASAILDFKKNFISEDIADIMQYKQKYLNFRKDTNDDFLCLSLVFQELDEILKELFDFFKDTDKNEFDLFEIKTIEVDSIEEAVKHFGENVKFSIPIKTIFDRYNEAQKLINIENIKNEIIMGDKIQVGDINNSGQIAIGKKITISTSQVDRNNLAEKIEELLTIIRQENIPQDSKQALITNFDKVKEEILEEEEPDKLRIAKWLIKIKKIVESIVLTHEASQAIEWIYKGLPQI